MFCSLYQLEGKMSRAIGLKLKSLRKFKRNCCLGFLLRAKTQRICKSSVQNTTVQILTFDHITAVFTSLHQLPKVLNI